MNTSDAFVFSGKIGFFYHQKNQDSIAINSAIAQFLGPELYVKFCEVISSYRRAKSFVPIDQSKTFSADFLKNPVDSNDEINDMDIYINFTFQSIMEALAQVVS